VPFVGQSCQSRRGRWATQYALPGTVALPNHHMRLMTVAGSGKRGPISLRHRAGPRWSGAFLLAGLGREAAAVDIVAIEALSSATINAHRKRAAGRNDSAELKLIAQLLRATGLKPPPPTAPAERQPDPFGMFATRNLSEAVAAGESPTAGGRLWTIADCFINPHHETN
jgi:hypothetical protein